MPQKSTRVSIPLTNLSVMYKNEEYIAGQVLADVPVKNESDQYWIYNSDYELPHTHRANGAAANMVTWEASTSSYRCTEHSLKDVLTDRDYNNADSALQIEKHTMENLIDKILMRQEYDTQQLLFTTTTFSNNTTILTATSWTYNTTTSNPIAAVLSATGEIIRYSGKRPNYMVTNWRAFEGLKENTNIYNRIQYVERAIVTQELLASLFDLNKVFVGTAVYAGSKEGETFTITSIWGNDALVGYFNPRPGLRDASTAFNFRVMQYGSPYKVKKWRDEEIDGNYIEVQSLYKPVAVATSCAYLFKAVTTA